MDYNLLKVIHPGIKVESDLKHLLDTTKKVADWHDLLFIDEPYERWTVFFHDVDPALRPANHPSNLRTPDHRSAVFKDVQ